MSWSFTIGYAYRLKASTPKIGASSSFLSRAAIVGIGLGVAVLTLLLSIMNGFEQKLVKALTEQIVQAELIELDRSGIDLDDIPFADYAAHPKVTDVIALYQAPALLQRGQQLAPVSLVAPLEQNVTQWQARYLAEEPIDLSSLASNQVLVSRQLMDAFDLSVGDSLRLLLAPVSNEPSKALALAKPRRVLVSIGGSFEPQSTGLDSQSKHRILFTERAFKKEFGEKVGPSHIQFVFTDPFNAPQLIRELGQWTKQPLYLSDWTRTHGHIYDDIQLVRFVVFLTLGLVIAVASFNIVSTLLVLTKEKSKELAILTAMGLSPVWIQRAFFIKGLHFSILGIVIGLSLGVLLARVFPAVVALFEQLAGRPLLNQELYFVERLPVAIEPLQLVVIASLALTVSLIACWFSVRRIQGLPLHRYLR